MINKIENTNLPNRVIELHYQFLVIRFVVLTFSNNYRLYNYFGTSASLSNKKKMECYLNCK